MLIWQSTIHWKEVVILIYHQSLKIQSMALLILKIRITSVFSGAISGVSIHKKFSPKGSKIETDYWLIIMITQVWNFQLAPNSTAELRPKTR